jgi:hypothetical protein
MWLTARWFCVLLPFVCASMVVLSHSRVASPSMYLDAATSAFLASVAPAWSAVVMDSSPSGPLVDARILFSPTHEDEVRVELQCTPTHEEHMVDAVGTERKESYTEPIPANDVLLTPMQLSQLHHHLSASSCPRHDTDGDSRMEDGGERKFNGSASSSLFYFTSGEWRALCEQVCVAIARPIFDFQLAECERFVATSGVGQTSDLESTITPQSFKSVFIPNPSTIMRRAL